MIRGALGDWAMRPTSPSPSSTAEPSVTPSIRPTLTRAERRNGLLASAITSPVTKVMRGFSRTLLSASSRAFFCSSCSAASRQPCPLQLAASLGRTGFVDPAVGAQVGEHARRGGDRLHRPGEARNELVDEADAKLLDTGVVDAPEQEQAEEQQHDHAEQHAPDAQVVRGRIVAGRHAVSMPWRAPPAGPGPGRISRPPRSRSLPHVQVVFQTPVTCRS